MAMDRLAVVIAAAPQAAWASPGALAQHIKSAMREPAEVTRERVAEALERYFQDNAIVLDAETVAQIAVDAMQRVNQ